MVKMYYELVKKDRITINQVPSRYRAAVQELLDNDTMHGGIQG